MMIVFLLLGNGEGHVSHYRMTSGAYKTACSLKIDLADHANTLVSDTSIPGLCGVCKDYYNDYCSMTSPRNYRLQNILDFHRYGVKGPEVDHYFIDEREWHKLTKYKRLVPKPIKKSKSKFIIKKS